MIFVTFLRSWRYFGGDGTNIETYRHTDIQTYRHTDIQIYRHTDMQRTQR